MPPSSPAVAMGDQARACPDCGEVKGADKFRHPCLGSLCYACTNKRRRAKERAEAQAHRDEMAAMGRKPPNWMHQDIWPTDQPVKAEVEAWLSWQAAGSLAGSGLACCRCGIPAERGVRLKRASDDIDRPDLCPLDSPGDPRTYTCLVCLGESCNQSTTRAG